LQHSIGSHGKQPLLFLLGYFIFCLPRQKMCTEGRIISEAQKMNVKKMRRNILVLMGLMVSVFAANSFGAAYNLGSPDGKMIVEDETFKRLSSQNKGSTDMRITLGVECVIVRGIRPEEQMWGAYQFPRPYNLGDRLVVGVHVANDNIESFGITNRWFESRDKGVTWKEIDPSVATECGLLLQNGDRLYFPMESGLSLDNYKMTPQKYYTPDYDFTKKSKEGTLPIPDGVTFWEGTTIRAYNADRLPDSLSEKVWLAMRTLPGQKEPLKEYVKVDWPYLTRVVHTTISNNRSVLKPIFPRGNLKIGPDGAIWVSVFSGEGHINPENGQYSPYYSAELFRSEDFGHSFHRRAHMEYEANGHEYPYLSGGFSDSDFEFMNDGSIVWFFRSNWFANTGEEWSPMYMSRSTDMGHTWLKPVRFAELGTLPRLCKLECGVTLLCYARPGTFVQVSLNDSGTKWSEPLVVMTPEDRSGLANKKIDKPSFHEWVGSCNNPELVPIDKNSALIFYSDFYYPDENGIKRKTILCRKITVER
jgi:hypothetical protein